MFIIFFIFLLSNNKDFSFFKKNRIVFLFSWSRCFFRWGLSRKQMAHSNWVKSSLKFEESLVKGLLERKGARDSAPRPEGSEPSPRCGERPVWKGSRRSSVRISQAVAPSREAAWPQSLWPQSLSFLPPLAEPPICQTQLAGWAQGSPLMGSFGWPWGTEGRTEQTCRGRQMCRISLSPSRLCFSFIGSRI